MTIATVSSSVPSPAPRSRTAVAGPSAFSLSLVRARPRPRVEQLPTHAPVAAEPWIWRAALGPDRSEVVARGVAGTPRMAQVEALRQAERAAAPIELGVTRELGLTLSRTDAGVALVLETAPFRAAPAEAQLPRIVAALRARGIDVAGATVRTTGRRPGSR